MSNYGPSVAQCIQDVLAANRIATAPAGRCGGRDERAAAEDERAVVTVVPSANESEGSDDSWAGWLEDESEQEECQVEQEEEDASVSPDNAETFVVRRVTYRYRLERGRYVKNGKRLDVQQQGRYFVEKHLNEILSATTGGGGDDDDDEKRRRRRWNNKRR